MELEALFDAVIVKPFEAEETTYGNIIVPDLGKEKNEMGTVMAVGPGKPTITGDFIPTKLKVGDKAFDAVGLKKNKEAVETVNRLKALGVLDQDITGEMIARNANLYGQGGQKGFSKAFGNFMTKVGNAYGTPDSYAKLIAFQSEFNGLKKALKVKDSDADELHVIASILEIQPREVT